MSENPRNEYKAQQISRGEDSIRDYEDKIDQTRSRIAEAKEKPEIFVELHEDALNEFIRGKESEIEELTGRIEEENKWIRLFKADILPTEHWGPQM